LYYHVSRRLVRDRRRHPRREWLVYCRADLLQFMGWQVLTLLRHKVACVTKLQQFHSDLVLRRPRSSRGRLEGRPLGLVLMVRDAARRARLLTMRPREFRVV